MNWKGLGRKRVIETYIGICLERLSKIAEPNDDNVTAEIRTEHLPNRSVEHFCAFVTSYGSHTGQYFSYIP